MYDTTKTILFCTLVSAFILITATAVSADIIGIPGDYSTIQAGLNAATAGDTVQVAAGTYVENIIWPDVNGIKLFGAGQDVSIIDGNQQASVIRFETAYIIDTTTVVRGFTITNGFAQPPWPRSEGGGIHLYYASPTLEYLNIVGNTADDFGGGIYMWGSASDPVIRYVLIADNTAASHGGVDCAAGSPLFDHVTVAGNNPGGIYAETYATIVNSISAFNVYYNLRVEGDSFQPTNIQVGYSDIWNGWQLIGYASVTQLAGIIYSNPIFVNQSAGDYHLQPDSPCIDTGDPMYPFDPDLTRTDMGAFYFHQYNVPQIVLSITELTYGQIPVSTEAEQSLTIYNEGDATLVLYDVQSTDPIAFFTDFDPSDSLIAAGDSLVLTVTFAPQEIIDYNEALIIDNNDELVEVTLLGSGVNQVSITLTPYSTPIVIPESGGNFNFNIAVNNLTQEPQTFDLWTQVELPGSGTVELLNVSGITIPAAESVNRDRTQFVPGSAPAGMYTYNAYVGDYPWEINHEDSFNFEKEGTDPGYLGMPSDWFQSGEGFEPWQNDAKEAVPTESALLGAYPNPFNPTTTIRYAIPDVAKVTLSVYDLQGRLVADLVNGQRNAGVHEVTFDASNLPSGVYFFRLNTQSFSAIGKVMLVK